MAHSYYVVMGGYAKDDSDADQKFMPENKPRVTLTGKYPEWMIRNNICLLPDLSESQICDNSKANGLAKMLVCTQAIWFCAQCIVRSSQSLTICLLELNTFAHAVCALLIYLLWWNKPLDVEEPSLLVGTRKDEFLALVLGKTTYNYNPDKWVIYIILHESQNKMPKGMKQAEAVFVLDQSRVDMDTYSSAPSGVINLRRGESICGWVYTGVSRTEKPSQTYDSLFEEI
jgi:hypothetical protein